MKLELSVSTSSSDGMVPRTYTYTLEIPNNVTLDAIESHTKAILRTLDTQAHSTEGEDDDEDSEKWKDNL